MILTLSESHARSVTSQQLANPTPPTSPYHGRTAIKSFTVTNWRRSTTLGTLPVGGRMSGSDELPGLIPRILSNGDVSLLRADERVFEAMLDGWPAQMLARDLTVDTINCRCRVIG